MNEAIDYSTLKWVKQELDNSLKQARLNLEAYVEDPQDESQLRFCAAHLHQVRGTLQMVELYGAAMLAEEMEALVQAFLDGGVGQREGAAELLMRAILQLPDYLDRLTSGHQDIPLVLLPLMNDLRAARGEHLLSENALFTPDLALGVPAAVREAADPEPAASLAGELRGLRHRYQLALLKLIRGQDEQEALHTLEEVVGQLQVASSREPAQQLWWICKGFLQALAGGHLDITMSAKLLLGQVDRQIKVLIDAGEETLAGTVPADLLKNLLFYVARAAGDNPVVAAIKDHYDLERLLPDGEQMAAMQDSLTGHNTELFQSVGAAVKDDLAGVKDALDLLIRSSQTPPDLLAPSVGTLHRVADTLGMLGLGALRKQVEQYARLAGEIAEGERAPEEAALMEIASGLLVVESALDGLAAGATVDAGTPGGADGEAAGTRLPASEYDQIRTVVADEALRDLGRAKEVILAGAGDDWDFERLQVVPQLFNQIRGGLLLLNEARAAALTDAVAHYLDEEVLGPRTPADISDLESLADAISSLEYYLENLRDNRIFSGSVLDVAERSVTALGHPPTAEAAGPAPVVPAADEEADFDVPGLDMEAPGQAPEEPAVEPAGEDIGEGTAPMVAPEAGPAGEVAGTASEGAPVEIDVPAEPAETAAAPASEPAWDIPEPLPAMDGEADEEILEIFLEESAEELANVAAQLERWLADAADEEALTTLRRSWHTLKGSGRLVGAKRMGEFAWAFESLLNRLIDGTIERSDALCSLLVQAAEALPQLVDQIQNGAETTAPIELLMVQAEVLARGEDIAVGAVQPEAAAAQPAAEETAPEQPQDKLTPSEAAAVAEDEAAAGDAPAPEEPEEVVAETAEAAGPDPELLDIFRREAADHLATIRAYLEACGEGSEDGCAITDELRRALHTLHGSARMTELDHIAELVHGADGYVRSLATSGQGIPAEGIEAIAQMADMVPGMIESIGCGASVPAGYDALLGAFDALHSAAEAMAVLAVGDSAPEPPAEPETVVEAERVAEPEGFEDVTDESPPAEAAPEAAVDQVVVDEGMQAPDAASDEEPDDELIEVFVEEGEEILEHSESTLQQWMQQPDDTELMESLQRDLHTLKGGARMASIKVFGDLSHALESLLIAVVDGQVPAAARLFETLQAAQDRLVQMLEAVRERKPLPAAADLMAAVEALRSGEETPPEAAAAVETEAEPQPDAPEQPAAAATPVAAPEVEPAPAPKPFSGEDRRKAPRVHQELVRVKAELLDAMVNNAGEISIYRSRLEQQVGSLRFNLGELGQTVDRLREQLRKLEIETEAQVLFRYERDMGAHGEQFDPLEMDRYSHLQELSRSMMESISDLVSIQGLLENTARDSETLLLQQSRVTTDLQEGLMRTRMVPFAGLAPRMRRVVRQAAQELGKRIDLVLEGAEGEVDRTIIDRIIAPIEHMLRNAVAHGIEAPAERRKAGKSETGVIKVSLAREASDVVIRIQDDGRGMNIDAIRRKAIERGLITADAEINDRDVMQFVLETGFSTASKVTQISGRGVGMDVVNAEVKQLGGALEIDSTGGKGTRFTIRLPFTLAISQSLLVQVADEVYAVPLSGIQGIARVDAEELARYYEDPDTVFEYAGERYRVRHMATLLGYNRPGSFTSQRPPLLLVAAGDQRMAVQVDQLLGSREAVVKSVGPQISTVRGVSGATILGDGRVVLILDMGALMRGDGYGQDRIRTVPVMPEAGHAVTALVVDDSITVRKVTARLLERNNMRVVTAKDGVDALAKLQDMVPDVMLLDIEMPRMDGFEVATHVRNDERLHNVPIVMITSRTGEKHRRRAEEIGVNRYLGKPYQESDLMDTINEVLEESQVHA